MKQLLFLILFPCLAMAQFPGNGNQKITLGEQSTADGLVYRGVASADTIRKPSIDTMAFILLDTNTNIIWQYKKAVNNAWTRLNLLPSDTTSFNYVNTYATQSVNGAKTFTSAVTGARFNPTSTTITGTGIYLPATNRIGISANNINQQTLHPNGITIFKPTPQNLSTTFRLIEIGTQGSIFASSEAPSRFNDYIFGLGYYWDVAGNPRYMHTETVITHQPIKASLYQGTFSIENSVVGTKDSIITFTRLLTLNQLGRLGIGQSNPTAVLHLKAGTATANTAPLKFTSGTNLTTAEAGTIEFNGTNLFFSPSTTRHTVNHGLTGSATLNFPSTTTLLSADLTITVTGAADGDVVSLGVPNAAVNANTNYSAWVSAANTVTVRFNNYSSGTIDPASGLFKVFVTK